MFILIKTHAIADFWIMGTCEPYVDAWAGGPIRFYAPAQGCDIQEEVRVCDVGFQSVGSQTDASFGPTLPT